MRLTRLSLRNYRVYEDALDLELPPGLVGIYGPNGAGKSVLLEAILFALYGKARTTIDEIRTAGVSAETLAEVEFEHEGHLYLVRRTISGQSHNVKAEAHADGLLVTSGARDVGRYVRSTLGMDDAAFRASVFAEQKQVAAFSGKRPEERKRLVLQLLGITPLDQARDAARRDARARREAHEAARRTLPDLDEKQRELDAALAAAAAAAEEAAAARDAEEAAAAEAAAAAAHHDELRDRQREYDALVGEGTGLRGERDQLVAQVDELTAELDGLAGLDAELAALEPQAAGLPEAEARLAALDRVAAAEARAARLAVGEEPPAPDDAGLEAARRAHAAAAERLAQLRGRRAAAELAVERAAAALDRAASLSGEAACPLCGQPLGAAFESVRDHRRADLEEAQAGLAALRGEEEAAAAATAAAQQALTDAERAHRAAARARAAWEQAAAARAAADRELAEVLATVVPPPAAGERDALAAAVEVRRAAAARLQEVRGRLARRPAAEAARASARERLAAADARLEALREKVRALGFKPEELDRAHTARRAAEQALGTARDRARRLEGAAAAAQARAAAAEQALAAARAQHERLGELADEARHLGRVADLLAAFRNELVGEVGPRLSAQAASLFGELTDREYDELRVDPDTYEVRIVDQGVEYGMDRFSGSETDLANLALRVAISEQVRFQSGGQVGLLVLDEVFGPLDDDRKERMLLALERLRAHFRQVLVVTHDREIKEQLPHAIEVRKLPGRRATAAVLAG